MLRVALTGGIGSGKSLVGEYLEQLGAIVFDSDIHRKYPLPSLSLLVISPPRSNLSTSQITINDVGSAEDFLAAIEGTIKNFNDGDLVSGVVVQVDRDEVLLDIGYKTSDFSFLH